ISMLFQHRSTLLKIASHNSQDVCLCRPHTGSSPLNPHTNFLKIKDVSDTVRHHCQWMCREDMKSLRGNSTGTLWCCLSITPLNRNPRSKVRMSCSHSTP